MLWHDSAALRNQRLIGLVIANPEPQISIGPFNGKSAMVQRDAGGPYLLAVAFSHFLNCNEGCYAFAFSNENCLSARVRTSCERPWYCRQKIGCGEMLHRALKRLYAALARLFVDAAKHANATYVTFVADYG